MANIGFETNIHIIVRKDRTAARFFSFASLAVKEIILSD